MHAVLYRPISADAPTWAENKITDIFKIISYSYTKKFYEVGSFSMVIPINEPSAELLEINTFLAVDDSDFLFVTGIKETESRITLEGYDLKYLLAGRITLFPTEEQDTGTYGYYVTKGSTGECICNIVRHNISEASDLNRRIYGFSVNNSAQGLAEDTYMTRLEPLDQVVATLCKNAGIGYDVTMEIGSSFGDGIRFEVIKGTDRSEKQTDVPKVIFAKSFLNVESLSREVGVDAEKNAIYAINGTNIDDAVVKLVNRDGEDKADYGVYRRETTVNVNCDVDEIDSYALKEAEDFISTDSFIVEAAAAESYKKEWFVGDIVTFRHKDIARDVPITAVEIQRTADKFTIKLSAKEGSLKPVSRISRTANKTANEITQKKFDDGYVLVVKELPEEGKKNKIYVLEAENSEVALLADDTETEETEGAKVIDGYVFVDGEWKKIGGGDGSGSVGEFTNEEKNSEIFNCYTDVKNASGTVIAKKNYINPKTAYAHVSGYHSSIDDDDSSYYSIAASILGGFSHILTKSPYAVIVGGERNKISTNGACSSIVGGDQNFCSSHLCFIGGGAHNTVCEHNSSVIAGERNTVGGGVSFIAGGIGNEIGSVGYAAIIGGSGHKIGLNYIGNASAIIGGQNNDVETINSAVIAGNNNTIGSYGRGNNIILGGQYNQSDGANCTVCGEYNVADASRNCFICGSNNKATYATNCIVCGSGAKATGDHLIVGGNLGSGNVFYITNSGDVYARSFNIISETSAAAAETSGVSEGSGNTYNLSETILQMRTDIESLKAEIAELKGETS